jgi:hypothetical protein
MPATPGLSDCGERPRSLRASGQRAEPEKLSALHDRQSLASLRSTDRDGTNVPRMVARFGSSTTAVGPLATEPYIHGVPCCLAPLRGTGRAGRQWSRPLADPGTTRPERPSHPTCGKVSPHLSYAAQMGHWSESLVDEALKRFERAILTAGVLQGSSRPGRPRGGGSIWP